MIKNSVLFLALLRIMLSWEKDKDMPPGTISVKIDGDKISFSSNSKVEDI